MRKFFRVVKNEMKKGNFSFLILIVGIIQVIIMTINLIKLCFN